MSHLHKQIRDAVETRLTGLATTGSSVFTNRVYSLSDTQLPALRIYTNGDDVVEGSISGTVVRSLTVVVECCQKAGTTLDDSLDQISLEVEVALASTPLEISGVPLNIIYQSSDIELEESDSPTGVKRLSYLVEFVCAYSAPDTII